MHTSEAGRAAVFRPRRWRLSNAGWTRRNVHSRETMPLSSSPIIAGISITIGAETGLASTSTGSTGSRIERSGSKWTLKVFASKLGPRAPSCTVQSR